MSIYHDEIEIEDFDYDEENEIYYYPCPCGDRFEITKVWQCYSHFVSLAIIASIIIIINKIPPSNEIPPNINYLSTNA